MHEQKLGPDKVAPLFWGSGCPLPGQRIVRASTFWTAPSSVRGSCANLSRFLRNTVAAAKIQFRQASPVEHQEAHRAKHDPGDDDDDHRRPPRLSLKETVGFEQE